MAIKETVRQYAVEPLVATLFTSLLVNYFGQLQIAEFMHDEARDILGLSAVLLAAALALWIGLFWIASSEFGAWLSLKGVLSQIDRAYVASAVSLLIVCVSCIVCAHVGFAHKHTQVIGLGIALEGLVNVPTLLNNTRLLLKLHAAYGHQKRNVAEIRPAVNR